MVRKRGDAAVAAQGPAVRWLDDTELQTWLNFAAVTMWLPAALDAQLQASAGISYFEYQVLARLSTSPDRTARMGELAQLANGEQSRVSHAVARMERQGWIERSTDPANRRSVLATLTDPGYALVEAAAPGHVEAVRQLVFDPLTETQANQLHSIALRIRRAVHPAEDFASQVLDEPRAPGHK